MSPCKHLIVFKTFSHSVFLKHHAVGRGEIIILFYKCGSGDFEKSLSEYVSGTLFKTESADFTLQGLSTLGQLRSGICIFIVKLKSVQYKMQCGFHNYPDYSGPIGSRHFIFA